MPEIPSVSAGGSGEGLEAGPLFLPQGLSPGPGRVAGDQLRPRGLSGGEKPGGPVPLRRKPDSQRPLPGLLPVLRHTFTAGAAGP